MAGREIKKVPALRGRTIVNLFYEASTRTSSSFELAAKRLSADVVNVRSVGSAVDKGESLKDTVQTLSAYDPAAIVIRSPHVGAAQLVAGWTTAGVINAGDGKHEHPTQALLDVFTLRRQLGSLDGARIWIVGDVLHSRVARSNILAFTRMGASVTVAGPPTLIPREIEVLGCEASATLDRLPEADVVYVLRMQNERMRESYVPTLREYAALPGLDKRLKPGQLLMHPGPVNRGVELSGDAIDSPQALIGAQVKAGVAVRMAVLYELLVGSRPWRQWHERATDVPPLGPPAEVLIRGAHVLDPRAGLDEPRDVLIRAGRVAEIAEPGAIGTAGRRQRRSRPGASTSFPVLSTPMSTSAPPVRSTRRTWRPGPPRRPPAASARSSRCPTPTRSSTTQRCSDRWSRRPSARPRSRLASWPRSRGA